MKKYVIPLTPAQISHPFLLLAELTAVDKFAMENHQVSYDRWVNKAIWKYSIFYQAGQLSEYFTANTILD